MSKEADVEVLKSQVETLIESHQKLADQVQALADAWNRANGVLSFVKWIAGLGATGSFIAWVFKVRTGGHS